VSSWSNSSAASVCDWLAQAVSDKKTKTASRIIAVSFTSNSPKDLMIDEIITRSQVKRRYRYRIP
jgi:hypothetical protein